LVGIFNRCFSQQRRDGLSVGESLLLAAIHRAIKPGSKRTFADWAAQTTLPEIASFDPARLDSQHFWDQMDAVTDEQLEAAEQAITQRMLELGFFSPKLLFYDLTNFFTYIASDNERSELAQRGHNKQKRHDLRQFGLAQVVTREFLLPVFSEVYPGNRSDAAMFTPTLTKVRAKLAELELDMEELTMIFDKGSNSKQNFAQLDASEIPYVASLTPAHHEALLAIPLSHYHKVALGDREISCIKLRKLIWGKERTLVLYVSEKLRAGQLRGLKQALAKKHALLAELKGKLNNPRAKKRKRADVDRELKKILRGEKCEQIIKVSVAERAAGHFIIDWEIDADAYRFVTETLYGKRILVTCRDNWSATEIIAAYQGQSTVERVFRHLKNPYHNAVHPQFHWTDHKVKVHTFICLLGLLLSQVLWKKAREAGHLISLETLLDRLGEVRQAEVLTLGSHRGRPARTTQLEQMEPELQKLYDDVMKQF
jgi:transposase